MKKHRLLFVLGFFLLSKISVAQSPALIEEYIATHRSAAIEEMQRSGVPAAITLAQGIHETSAGTSNLVLASNNHFGIKCKSTWTGDYVLHDDDAKNERFRKYSNARESYADHSDFLRNGQRYSFLFQLDPTDYEGWAYGLKRAGYATNPKYPQILIKLIKDYHLDDYTLVALGRKSLDGGNYLVNASTFQTNEAGFSHTSSARKASYQQGVFKINDTKVVYVPKGTSLLALAEEHHLSLRRLFDFNDMEPQDITDRDVLIYLQRKRKTGVNEEHKVEPGETLYDIAQAEGIRIDALMDYNFLDDDMEPQAGEILQLRRKAAYMPKVTSVNEAVAKTNNLPTPVKENTVTYTPVQQQIASAIMSKDAYVMHKVQPKETMYSIAKKYAVSMDDVLKWNDLQTSDIKIGQELRIIKRM